MSVQIIERLGAKDGMAVEERPVVFVVDDDVSVRESLELLVHSAGWIPEAFSSAGAFLARPRVDVPGCLVLDVSPPDLSALEVQKRVADRAALPVIVIAGHADIPTSVQAMKAGALEFLTKPLNADAMRMAIGQAIDCSRIALRKEAEIRALRDRYASLTPREQQVMELVVAGRLNKQVGEDLGISEVTVKVHRGKVMQKMKAPSFAHLVIMAGKMDQAMTPQA